MRPNRTRAMSLGVLLSVGIAVAQKGDRCGTRDVGWLEALDLENTLIQSLAAVRQPGSVTVNVWFHVINQGQTVADGNVTDAQIAAQMRDLNDTYSLPGGANTPFRFRLRGVTRTSDATWFNGLAPRSVIESQMKAALRKGDKTTLNIYTANLSNNLLGWATFPWDAEAEPRRDGVVLLYTTLPGVSTPPFNLGYTGTHEVGHWLGLFHTFMGGCASIDRVFDTPAEAVATDGCPVGKNTCPLRAGVDPIRNFMDYSDDACMREFTPGQSQRSDNLSLIWRGL